MEGHPSVTTAGINLQGDFLARSADLDLGKIAAATDVVVDDSAGTATEGEARGDVPLGNVPFDHLAEDRQRDGEEDEEGRKEGPHLVRGRIARMTGGMGKEGRLLGGMTAAAHSYTASRTVAGQPKKPAGAGRGVWQL